MYNFHMKAPETPISHKPLLDKMSAIVAEKTALVNARDVIFYQPHEQWDIEKIQATSEKIRVVDNQYIALLKGELYAAWAKDGGDEPFDDAHMTEDDKAINACMNEWDLIEDRFEAQTALMGATADAIRKRGTIYVFTNPSMPGLIKIGKTRDLDKRLADADKTFSASPFECPYAIEVDRYEDIERSLHIMFGDMRERQNREFFRMSAEAAGEALDVIKGLDDEIQRLIEVKPGESNHPVIPSEQPATPTEEQQSEQFSGTGPRTNPFFELIKRAISYLFKAFVGFSVIMIILTIIVLIVGLTK